jgi:hypothetical protein
VRVIIETAVFSQPDTAVQLLHLFGLGLQRRHRLQVEDDQSPEVRAWLDGLNPQQRDDCQQVLKAGFELESREPSRHELWVARVDAPDFTSHPPRLPLLLALQVLSRPFRLVVENRGADRAFLLCMCTPQQRGFLLEYEQAGFLEFENGNGLESMSERANSLKSEPHALLLHYFLFDSDALQPGQPSAQSEKLRRTCGHRLPHYQLRRRFIESYLPLNAIRGWAYGRPRREIREQRGARFQAYARLRTEQRYYYNVKHGFSGDAGRIAQRETPGSLFDGVSDADLRTLENGLDRSLAELYEPPGQHVTEPDLRTDGGWAEMNPVVSEIIARIR